MNLWRKFLSILPLLLLALVVMAGFLWYTGRLTFGFETYSVYSNNDLGVSFRYPSSWEPFISRPIGSSVTNLYSGWSGFFSVDAADLQGDMNMAAEQLIDQRLKRYGENPTMIALTAGGQEARAIVPSQDESAIEHEVALLVRYPKPLRIYKTTYHYLVIEGDPKHIKVFADTLEFTKP